jgi:ribonuclease HI
MSEYALYTDGGARGNPGPSGIGYVIFKDGKEILRHGEYIGEATNNQAEYRALIAGLEKIIELGGEKVKVFMDSELVVKQLTGIYKIKNENIRGFAAEVLKLSNKFQSLTYQNIPREQNEIADAEVNRAIDEEEGT